MEVEIIDTAKTMTDIYNQLSNIDYRLTYLCFGSIIFLFIFVFYIAYKIGSDE